MEKINRLPQDPEGIFLCGRDQVDTAIAVLALTGANPYAENMLSTIRRSHDGVDDGQGQDDLVLSFRSESGNKMREDIMASALQVQNNSSLPEEPRIAASKLLRAFGLAE